MTKEENIKYLIIGNSAGGIGAAEAIRTVDKIGSIAIVSDESYHVYSRPLISEYLSEKCPLERMLFRPPDFYEKNHIQTFTGQKVTGLDVDKHKIRLNGGKSINYEKLLLATGGSPIIPDMKGTGFKGVFTFTTLDDAKAIDRLLSHYHRKIRAVVIGGGLIGMSVTEALVKRGINVTVVELKERILSTILDEETSALEEQALNKAGVEIITGHTVSKINNHLPCEASGVTIDDGKTIYCEMIIFAIGVQPRIELAADAGIRTNHGIIINGNMATNTPDVYACGDVTETYDFIHRENRLIPIWPNAYTGGKAAGLNMAGVNTRYHGGVAMNSLKYFGVNIVSAGIVTPPNDSYETLSVQNGDIYRKVVLKEGQIAGLVFAGDIEKAGIIFNLMKDRINVEPFKHVLVSADFGLISIPEEIWRPRLAIPDASLDSTESSVEQSVKILVKE